ncbi:GFA family protein [Actibacterium sp. MT2.3-13A]|uniref:GFA family protein n=1 Tax=Actibacterium sp. MT2.3-13A TaxID=2828332 RepID=UPI001BAD9195|nr:GFA family protein [Actibacterium sp. MT2.3-13A]
MHKGSCLCGAVRLTVSGELVAPDACHCSQCRKQSGHFWASTNVPKGALAVEGAENVTWFRSSETAERGFCSTCGSFLFWREPEGDHIAVGMGAFESPTGTHLAIHIYVDDRGDYYEIADGLPQRAQ